MQTYIRIFSIMACLLVTCSCSFSQNAERWGIKNIEVGREERQLCGDLCKNIISFISDSNEIAGKKSEEIAETLLNFPHLSVKGYFCSAVAFNILNKQQRAIGILETAIEQFPNERAPIGIVMPAKIVGQFWIAGLARQIGDFEKAKKTYETILDEVEKIEYEGKESDLNLCRLHIAEIESDNLKRQDLALERLKTVKIDKEKIKSSNEMYDIYKDWAEFQQLKISKGKSEAAQLLKEGYPGMMSDIIGLAVSFRKSTIMIIAPLSDFTIDKRIDNVADIIVNRMIEKSNSSMDRNITRLTCGYAYEYGKRFEQADKHYTSLFQDESYFSPIAGISLARVKKTQGKVDEANNILDEVNKKYPGYGSVVSEEKKLLKK